MHLDYPMKPNGMYVLSREDIEQIAHDVLTEFMPEVLKAPRPLDIEYMAQECLYLELKHMYLSPDGSILGMIAFDDMKLAQLDDYRLPVEVELNAGTIITDGSLEGPEHRQRKRFTQAHEVAHWICQRSYHSPDNRVFELRTEVKPFIACRVGSVEQHTGWSESFWSDHRWEEWQADTLASALLMPREQFGEEAYYQLMGSGLPSNYLCEDIRFADASRRIINALAEKFHVSKQAARIRLYQLGFYRNEKNWKRDAIRKMDEYETLHDWYFTQSREFE